MLLLFVFVFSHCAFMVWVSVSVSVFVAHMDPRKVEHNHGYPCQHLSWEPPQKSNHWQEHDRSTGSQRGKRTDTVLTHCLGWAWMRQNGKAALQVFLYVHVGMYM
ncbi:hypothetical protein DFP73DRAFT_541699 [Morchella snyderi]|nr:hypothetical protein DFP73DRAFT_541699 [Morchella snyderi]